MKLSDLLTKYKQLPIVDRMLYTMDMPVSSFVTIRKQNQNGDLSYLVEPTKDFCNCTGSISTRILLNSSLELEMADCGCLEHYRKKECVHTTLLYALALKSLNPTEFEKEIEAYQKTKRVIEQGLILNKLADDLRTNSSYFKKIHLTPEINSEGGALYLSLHIGYDKEYIIKSISEFILNMETNRYYSYGQKLAFVHSYEVLDDTSKEFYSFLLNISHEDSLKNIKIKRSQFLKILEIYHTSGLYISKEGAKPIFYMIEAIDQVKVILDKEGLYLNAPAESKALTCGVNSAYFIGTDKIYAYHFKKRNEAIIFSNLFKSADQKIRIEGNEQDFISNLLPVIKREVTIENSFYESFRLPDVVIHSYFVYKNGFIINEPNIEVEKKYMNTPYVMQILDGYYKCLETFGFISNDEGEYYLNTLELQYQFLTTDLSTLKNYGDVFFDETVKKITLKKSRKVNVAISYNVGLLDFKIQNEKLTIEEIQAMLSAYRHRKKFVKLKNDVLMEIKEEDVKELDNFLEDFNIDLQDLGKPISKPLSYVLKLISDVGTNVVCDERLSVMIAEIQSFKQIPDLPDSNFLQVLRPYQVEAFKWLRMLAKFGFGGILADDMGLGKTLEIISFLASDTIKKPTLIVCPMSLIYNWENECVKWNLDIPVRLVIGSALEREEIIQQIDFDQKAIYITSYDSLRRDVEHYKKEFRFIVADEAQYIKNQNALKSAAIKQLKSQMNFALTGTPIENGLADLWSIFDYLMPGYLASYSRFKSRYEALILHDDQETLEVLKKRVQPFILRRTKKDVLKELPEKSEEIYYCRMDDKQEEIYHTYVERIKHTLKNNGKDILSLITRLRQICITPELIFNESFSSAKLNLALELIQRAIASNHRILVFSQFSSVFPILASMLDAEAIPYFILDGKTKSLERMELADSFNSNPNIKVFMISLKAGGTGLNLVGADMVIHLDPWWNVSAENQATDRAYRIGQTRNVHVLKLVCKDTIEEKVLLLQKVKRELADTIIHSEEKNIVLTKEEIFKLLD